LTGDGIRQTNETFLSGIDVTLYPDSNGNGLLDANELATPRAGDVNGDGFDDFIVGAASGPSPHVVVRDGRTQEVLDSTLTWSGFPGNGVRVGSADVNRDGFDDLIVGSGPGSARVTIRDGRTHTVIEDFFGVDPFSVGGVFVG
jgi:hypothetical protein